MSLGMDPGIRARWTTALRSGTIPQATGALRKDAGRCCLGVLADLGMPFTEIADLIDGGTS